MLVRNLALLPAALLACVLELRQALALDVSFFGDSLVRKDQVQQVLEHQPVKDAACSHIPTGPIETTQCDYETVESVNDELFGHLHELVAMPFFRYFRIDLNRECPFWQDDGLCMYRQCGVTTMNESEIPEKWRAAALSKIEMTPEEERNTLPGCYYRDSDFCFLDDATEGEYVDLQLNPEQFTGYAGLSAHRVWSSIYNENCFGISELNLLTSPSAAPVTLPDTMTDVLRDEGSESSEQCLEKRVYYKIISGLHASISTHLCHDFMDQKSGEWSPNLQCFVTRVASHPERLQYIYFNTVLLLRAVARIGPFLNAYDYCSTGTHEEDAYTLEKLGAVIDAARVVGQFDESVLFRGENANILKEEFKTHFRNVSRIMDCVGCDKCRLWGKMQTSGIGTALKVLFELDEAALDPKTNANLLSRSEVVALINTLHRFSESLQYVEDFRQMWADTPEDQSKKLIHDAEKAVVGHPRQHPPGGSRVEPSLQGSLLNRLNWRLTRLAHVCQRRTSDCVHGFLRVLGDILASLETLYQRKDKRDFPHADL